MRSNTRVNTKVAGSVGIKSIPGLVARAVIVSCALFTSASAEMRTWTSADGGKTFVGELKSYDAASGVVMVVVSGKEIRFAVEKLSAADIDFLKRNPAAGGRTNSLGMKFVPVRIAGGPTDGKAVLFSVWETRVDDFDAFLKANKDYKRNNREGDVWEKDGYKETGKHPVTMVSWNDAQAFCKWLTEKEREAGNIGPNDTYRLPSDHEWSCAIGIGESEDASLSPNDKSIRIPGYPWGEKWPPESGVGNLMGEEFKKDHPHARCITGYRDDSVFPERVGSFPASSSGLFDLVGNVKELCMDTLYPIPAGEVKPGDADGAKARVVRGSSFRDDSATFVFSSCRLSVQPDMVDDGTGFRCVLELAGGAD